MNMSGKSFWFEFYRGFIIGLMTWPAFVFFSIVDKINDQNE